MATILIEKPKAKTNESTEELWIRWDKSWDMTENSEMAKKLATSMGWSEPLTRHILGAIGEKRIREISKKYSDHTPSAPAETAEYSQYLSDVARATNTYWSDLQKKAVWWAVDLSHKKDKYEASLSNFNETFWHEQKDPRTPSNPLMDHLSWEGNATANISKNASMYEEAEEKDLSIDNEVHTSLKNEDAYDESVSKKLWESDVQIWESTLVWRVLQSQKDAEIAVRDARITSASNRIHTQHWKVASAMEIWSTGTETAISWGTKTDESNLNSMSLDGHLKRNQDGIALNRKRIDQLEKTPFTPDELSNLSKNNPWTEHFTSKDWSDLIGIQNNRMELLVTELKQLKQSGLSESDLVIQLKEARSNAQIRLEKESEDFLFDRNGDRWEE